MANVKFKQALPAALGQTHPSHGATDDFESTQPMGLPSNDAEPVWHESSFDLRIGLEAVEHPFDTLPGDLRDLFPRP